MLNFIMGNGSSAQKINFEDMQKAINDKNISNLKNIRGIKGFLVGSASQNSKKFIDIIKKTIN